MFTDAQALAVIVLSMVAITTSYQLQAFVLILLATMAVMAHLAREVTPHNVD